MISIRNHFLVAGLCQRVVANGAPCCATHRRVRCAHRVVQRIGGSLEAGDAGGLDLPHNRQHVRRDPATADLIQKMRDLCPESMIGKRDRALLAFGSTREVVMWYWYSAVATAAVLLSGFGATAGELPTYEIMGVPVTQHQLMAVNSAYVRERSPIPTLTLGGMPASPIQILVLTPRPKEEIAAQGGPDGSPPTVTP